MMTKDSYILGVSCFFHDSSITLMKNGRVMFATEEEKLSRKKHDDVFPEKAIEKCLTYCNITIDDIEVVGFYEKPFLKFENFLQHYIRYWPWGFYGFLTGVKSWLSYKLWFSSILKEKTGYTGKIVYVDHHLSHAAGAFFGSNFDRAAVLTIDGVGEESTTTWGVGSDNDLDIKQKIVFPNSLGLLYSAFTAYLGFDVNEGEYKVMGLAPYGKPVFKDLILKELILAQEDGSFELNMDYFSFQYGKKMYNKKFERLFGLDTRQKEDDILGIHKNIASSLQKALEEVLLKLASYIYDQSGEKHLCISGGVGLNCVANYRLLKESPFENVFVQPSPGDGGSSMGVCSYIYHCILNEKRRVFDGSLYLGEHFSQKHIETVLEEIMHSGQKKIFVEKLDDKILLPRIADLISKDKVIGWFQGRTEFGPRALGNRSILGNPCNSENWKKINLKIKFRESFRPFAPSVLEERAPDFFDVEGSFPYMLFVAKTAYKDKIPAVVHLDDTSRLQTVTQEMNKRYYKLIQECEKKIGVPMLINTSFNLSGEPIVNSPKDAFNTFIHCEMDYLVIENYLISKR